MKPEIPILFRDDQIIVVEKPIGISIHNTEDPINLIELVKTQTGLRKLSPVHRLDKETSGVQIFAITEAAASQYAELFQSRLTQKTYSGILRGDLKSHGGIWNQPLSDKSEGRTNPAGVIKDRIPCETRFQVVEKSKYFTRCEFDLITGRQHQIRKHAALSGHALVGDLRYGDTKYNRKISDLYSENRMFLHCSSIAVPERKFTAPAPTCFSDLFR